VFVASREWSADGANTPTSWLMHHGQMTSIDAARLVRNARLVHAHERTAKLLDSGVEVAHVKLAPLFNRLAHARVADMLLVQGELDACQCVFGLNA
jgi:hypothetical protein